MFNDGLQRQIAVALTYTIERVGMARRRGIGLVPGLVGAFVAALVATAILISLGIFLGAKGTFHLFVGVFILGPYVFFFGLIVSLPIAMVLEASEKYSILTAVLAGAGAGVSPFLISMLFSKSTNAEPHVVSLVGLAAAVSLAGGLAGATFFEVQQWLRYGRARATHG